MEIQKDIKIELVNGTLNDYVVKDKDKILIGRFTIIDLDKQNKRCNVKFKFYRKNNSSLLLDTLDLILKAIFKDNDIFKANFIVNENMNLKAFLDRGFTLEAILTDNLFINGSFLDELILGINRNEYVQVTRHNVVELKGANLLVRNFTPDDGEELLEYYIKNENHLKNFEPTRDKSFYTIETQKEILFESYKQLMNGTGCDFGIFLDNKLIGKIKISNIVYGVFKSGIIGYSIDKDFQGMGYMKQGVSLVLDYAKEYLDLHRIEGSVLVENNRSKGVLTSLGFEEVGLNKKYLFINGKWRDHITYYKIL